MTLISEPKSNMLFVNSIEEFEELELDYNETKCAFDNFNQCFYLRSRDKCGEYSSVDILFYQNFEQKVQSFEREEFIKKCKDVGLNELKTECACKFFLDNMKPYDVWIWVTSEKGKDWSWDYVYNVKSTLGKMLFPKVV